MTLELRKIKIWYRFPTLRGVITKNHNW